MCTLQQVQNGSNFFVRASAFEPSCEVTSVTGTETATEVQPQLCQSQQGTDNSKCPEIFCFKPSWTCSLGELGAGDGPVAIWGGGGGREQKFD